MERDVDKVQDPVPPLKRELDQVLDKEMKNELEDEEGTVKPESKVIKNVVKEQNQEHSSDVTTVLKYPP